MNKRLIILLKNHWVFKIRYVLVLSFLLMSLIVSSFYYTFNTNPAVAKTDTNLENIYNTWKVLKYYENGKLIVNNNRFENLRLRINKDGTADWIKDGYESSIEFSLTKQDDNIYANKHSLEGKETIYEIKNDRLRFGRRDQMAHYEYIMVPWNYVK